MHLLTPISQVFTLGLWILLGKAATIPRPGGPYGVSLSTAKLVDTSRRDPFAPDSRKRAVMVSTFVPSGLNETCNSEISPYMPPATAALQDQYFSVSVLKFMSDLQNLISRNLMKSIRRLDFPTVLLDRSIFPFAIKLPGREDKFKTSQ